MNFLTKEEVCSSIKNTIQKLKEAEADELQNLENMKKQKEALKNNWIDGCLIKEHKDFLITKTCFDICKLNCLKIFISQKILFNNKDGFLLEEPIFFVGRNDQETTLVANYVSDEDLSTLKELLGKFGCFFIVKGDEIYEALVKTYYDAR